MVCNQNCYSTEWLPLNFLYIILGGGKVERLKSTVSTDHSSDTSQQVGFLYQMTKRSELSGLNDNPSDQKCDVKTDTPQAAEPRKTSIPFISKFLKLLQPITLCCNDSCTYRMHGCSVGWKRLKLTCMTVSAKLDFRLSSFFWDGMGCGLFEYPALPLGNIDNFIVNVLWYTKNNLYKSFRVVSYVVFSCCMLYIFYLYVRICFFYYENEILTQQKNCILQTYSKF